MAPRIEQRIAAFRSRAPVSPATRRIAATATRAEAGGGDLRGRKEGGVGEVGGGEQAHDDPPPADRAGGEAARGPPHFARREADVVPPLVRPEDRDERRPEGGRAGRPR